MEIKFRVWMSNDLNPNGKMYYPEDDIEIGIGNNKEPKAILMSPFGDLYTFPNGVSDGSLNRLRWSNNGIDTMIFTTLKDKNGVDVYEGDILREVPKDDWEKENYACFEVFFHDGDAASDYNIGFTMDRMHCHGAVAGGVVLSFKPKKVSKMIVIGNIHENKELLK